MALITSCQATFQNFSGYEDDLASLEENIRECYSEITKTSEQINMSVREEFISRSEMETIQKDFETSITQSSTEIRMDFTTITDEIKENVSTNQLLLEEYILSNLDHVRAMVRLKDIPHCLVLSGEAGQLLKLAGGHVTRKRFDQLYLTVRDMTPQEMERNYSIPAPRAEILLPTMMVIRSFMDMTGAESLHLTTSSLKEGVVAEMRDEALGRPDLGTEDMISQAEALADAYGFAVTAVPPEVDEALKERDEQ